MDRLERLLNTSILPERRIFFVGAGISADDPTRLPLGNDMTRAYLYAYTPPDFADSFLRLFRETSNFTGKDFPRLEAVVNDIRLHRPDVLQTFDFLGKSEPNTLHHWLAKQMQRGACVFTTNFDSYIERAYKLETRGAPLSVITQPDQAEGADLSGTLVKLHGDLRDLSTLGVTLDMIQAGLPRPFLKLIHKALDTRGTFIFLGYSGLDSFDVTPAFQTYSPNYAHHGIWVFHEVQRTLRLVTSSDLDAGEYRRADRILGAFGANTLIAGSTSDLCNAPTTVVRSGNFSWRDEFERTVPRTISSLDRSLIASQLAAMVGWGSQSYLHARNIFIAGAKVIPTAARNLLANAYRDMGYYRNEFALHQRWRNRGADPALDRLTRDRRLLSCLHLYGSPEQRMRLYREVREGKSYQAGPAYERMVIEVENLKCTLSEFSWFYPYWTSRVDELMEDLTAFLRRAREALSANYDTRYRADLVRAIRLFERIEATPEQARELDAIRADFLAPIQLDVEPYLETDSILGVINARRQHAKELQLDGDAVSAREQIEQIIPVCRRLKDAPGLCKAFALLACNRTVEAALQIQYRKHALAAMRGVQWSSTATEIFRERHSL